MKPKAHEWRKRDIQDWNATTFRAYLEERHEEVFGVPYVRRGSIPMEAKLIKTSYETYGKEVIKDFIDECFKQYRPTPQYPSLNFWFMYTYMRDRILPKVLKSQKTKKAEQKAKSELMDDLEWL